MTLYTVTKPDTLSDPSYHPDGSKIVFAEHVGSAHRISTVTNEISPVHTVLLTGTLPYADPYYSADGNFILFAVQMSGVTGPHPYGVWSLFYMRSDGTGVTTVLDDGNANIHPTWVTPIQIAFQSWIYGVSTTFQISMIDLAGQGRIDLGEGSYPRTVTA